MNCTFVSNPSNTGDFRIANDHSAIRLMGEGVCRLAGKESIAGVSGLGVCGQESLILLKSTTLADCYQALISLADV